MRRVRYVVRLAREVISYGIADRHYGLVLVLALGVLIVLVGMTVHAVAPIAIYPFA